MMYWSLNSFECGSFIGSDTNIKMYQSWREEVRFAFCELCMTNIYGFRVGKMLQNCTRKKYHYPPKKDNVQRLNKINNNNNEKERWDEFSWRKAKLKRICALRFYTGMHETIIEYTHRLIPANTICYRLKKMVGS